MQLDPGQVLGLCPMWQQIVSGARPLARARWHPRPLTFLFWSWARRPRIPHWRSSSVGQTRCARYGTRIH
eukprot:4913064-Alexandrium_andersonii.AAC.1